ncbi:MAG: TonB family protein [Flavobacteriales bacterium]
MELLGYLIKVNVLLLAAYAIYVLLLKRETFFQLNRFYLLFTALLALVAPLVQWNSFTVSPQSYERVVAVLPEVWVGRAVASADEPMSPWVWFYVVCAGGMIIRLTWLVWSTWRAVRDPQHNAAFTFFNRVVVSASLPHEGKPVVLAHEDVHRRQWHSADVLFFELVHCLCWFNPFMPAIKRSVRLNHEFLADADALRHTGQEEYARMLVAHAMHTDERLLVHSFFSQTLLKPRITMMYTTRSSHRKLWKYAAILPVFALMIAAQTTVLAQSETPKESDSKVAPPSSPVPPAPAKAPKAPPAPKEKASSKEAPAVKEIPVTKESPASKEKVPATKEKAPMPEKGIKEIGADDISGPDQMPEYNGGQEAMFKYLSSQLKYPEGVKASGTVLVSFIVKADGRVSNAQIKRSVAPELDKEALRVVSAMPNWKPAMKDGKPVDCEMVLPVKFAL